MITQVINWYLRYFLSYRDIVELFFERGVNVDHSKLNCWVFTLLCLLLEKRLIGFRKQHCGAVREDKTYSKVKGKWKYLYRVINKDGTLIDLLLTARRNIQAARLFFRKVFKEGRLYASTHIGTDKAFLFQKKYRPWRKRLYFLIIALMKQINPYNSAYKKIISD